MFVTLSLSKTSRAFSCAFALRQLRLGDHPPGAPRSSSSSSAASTDASDVPSVAVADSV